MKTTFTPLIKQALLLVTCVIPLLSFAQQIKLHSVAGRRVPIDQGYMGRGYTLDGYFMQASRGKLLFPDNFGSSGIYSKSIAITDGYYTPNSLLTIGQNLNIDLFFFGAFNRYQMAGQTFSPAEIDSLHEWSLRGGKLIIAASANDDSYNSAFLNNRWKFDIALFVPSFVVPTTTGKRTKIFTGPFGNVASAAQGGSLQGYFNSVPPEAVVLAESLDGKPTMILDCTTRDLIVADVDIFTSLGGLSTALSIENAQDRLWANTIAFMDNMEIGSPVILSDGKTFSTANKYASYEWYFQNMMLSTDPEFTPPVSGAYKLRVTYDYGCKSDFSKTIEYTKSKSEPGRELDVLITPNPSVNDLLNIMYILPDANEYTTDFVITDPAGRLVFSSGQEKVQASQNHIITNVNTLASAVYNIEITVGGRSFMRRFIKM